MKMANFRCLRVNKSCFFHASMKRMIFDPCIIKNTVRMKESQSVLRHPGFVSGAGESHASALICVYEQAAKADCEYLIYQNNQIIML